MEADMALKALEGIEALITIAPGRPCAQLGDG